MILRQRLSIAKVKCVSMDFSTTSPLHSLSISLSFSLASPFLWSGSDMSWNQDSSHANSFRVMQPLKFNFQRKISWSNIFIVQANYFQFIHSTQNYCNDEMDGSVTISQWTCLKSIDINRLFNDLYEFAASADWYSQFPVVFAIGFIPNYFQALQSISPKQKNQIDSKTSHQPNMYRLSKFTSDRHKLYKRTIC